MDNDNNTHQKPWAPRLISYFDVGDNTIKVDLSSFNSRESVYVNDVLVSKKYNLKLHAVHAFSIGNEAYEVRVSIASIFKGPINVALYRDGQQIDSDTYDLFPTGKKNGFTYSLISGFGFGVGAVVGFMLVKALLQG